MIKSIILFLLYYIQNYTKIISDGLPAAVYRRPAQNSVCDVTQERDVTQTFCDVTEEADQEAERDQPLARLSEHPKHRGLPRILFSSFLSRCN